MKLFSTSTSERASKGQGGNKYLLTVITAEIARQRQEIVSVSIVNSDKGHYMIDIKLPDGKQIRQFIGKGEVFIAKGEKQKDECADDWIHSIDRT